MLVRTGRLLTMLGLEAGDLVGGILGLTGGFDFFAISDLIIRIDLAGIGRLLMSVIVNGTSITGGAAVVMGGAFRYSISIIWRLKCACIFSRRNCKIPKIHPQMRNKKGTKSCFNVIGERLCSI